MSRVRIALVLLRDQSTISYNVRCLQALLESRRDLCWHLEQLRDILREKGVLRR